MASPFWASVSSSVKWEQECLSHRIWQEDQMTQQLVCWLVFSSHLSYLSILLLSQPCDFDCGTGMDGFNESSTASFEWRRARPGAVGSPRGVAAPDWQSRVGEFLAQSHHWLFMWSWAGQLKSHALVYCSVKWGKYLSHLPYGIGIWGCWIWMKSQRTKYFCVVWTVLQLSDEIILKGDQTSQS